MADFDGWGTPPDGQGPMQEPPYQGSDGDGWGGSSGDDWGDSGDDWGVPTPSDDFTPEQGGFPAQSGGFEAPQGSFIQPDDDGWGSTSGVDESAIQPSNPNDFASSEAGIQEFQPRRFNLSMKKVAFIVLVAGVLAALLFLGLDKIHIGRKTPSQSNSPPTQQTQQGQQSNQSQNQNQGGNQQSQQEPSGGSQTDQPSQNTPVVDGVTLIEIPDTMTLDYNGDILEANGKVINKLKYVQGHQVLYCINIGVAVGSSSETVSYYCNYSSFNAVKEGDIVVLKYQQVNDSYISVISISK